MVHIKEFAVEQWMDSYETWATHNMAETCCASVSLKDLVALSGKNDLLNIIDFDQKQVYGAIRGSESLRSKIASLYHSEGCAPLPRDNILATNGAIQANFLAIYTQIGPGDHIICHYPTYQQLYSVPESLGAEVSLWRAQEQNGWQLDLEELKSLIRPHTKMIIINNPENPTGAVLRRPILQGIVDIAREHGIMVHSDEVYRPLFHSLLDGEQHPPSILSFDYENTVATGSMSKAFSLAGIRLGWIASRNRDIIEKCASTRDYTIISVSQIDDRIATYALSKPTVDNLLGRNTELARKNLNTLEEFLKDFSWAVKWVRPQAGTTAFIKFMNKHGQPVDDVELCKRLQERTGVMFVPGSRCFGEGSDFKGYVRVGFVPEHQVLLNGLKSLKPFMESEYERLPLSM